MKSRLHLPLWVIALIALCCAVEVTLTIAPFLGYGAARSFALIFGGFWSVVFWQGQGAYPGQPVLMFLSYGLLHGGLLHLAMNMISMAAVARELARFASPARMALIYLVSQIAAAGLFAILAPTSGPMVGASGALFGLVGALIAQAGKWRVGRSMSLRPIWRAVLVVGGLNVALTFLVPAIAWQAHLGGLLAGLLIGLMLPVKLRNQAAGRRLDSDLS